MKTAGIFNFGSSATQWTAKADKAALSQGAHIVRKCCEEAGLEVLDLCHRWQPVDVLMVSLYWWEHVYDLVKKLAASGIQYEREKRGEKPVVFVGGQLPGYNPAPLREMVDLACIGDGEEAAPAAIRVLLDGGSPRDCLGIPGIWVAAEDNGPVEMQQVADISASLRWPFVNVDERVAGSGVRSRRGFERRIEIARGCRRKCAYCGVSWTKAYREAPAEDVAREIGATDGCVKCFAPDLMAHSRYDLIAKAYDETDRFNQARDISAAQILSRGFGKSRSYSTGIDGISSRLRLAVNKPLTQDRLVEVVLRANRHMGGLMVYLILDMPGERPDDIREWFETLRTANADLKPERQVPKSHLARGFSAERFFIMAILNAFNPTPPTPLQWAGINWQRNLTEDYMAQIDILGPQDDRRLKHKLLGRAHGATSRLLESAVLRGGPEMAPFIFAMAKQRHGLTGANGTAKLFATARKLGLEDHLRWTAAEKGIDEALPWEQRVKPLFPRRTLEAGWRKYRRLMGLKPELVDEQQAAEVDQQPPAVAE